jgi:large subunit ribosomal protein L13
MIPRGPLGRRQMKNLRVYAGANTRMKPSSRPCSTSPLNTKNKRCA